MSSQNLFTVKKHPDTGLWTCPQCGRLFERKGQMHSCRPYPLAQHFERKPYGKLLYKILKERMEEQLGGFRVESLECCIHFVTTSTFAAVKILKDGLRIDFSLARHLEHPRFSHEVKMSAHRYLYFVDIKSEEDIDPELLDWLREARDKKEKEKQHL